MRIVCATGVQEAKVATSDLDVLVLPERTTTQEIRDATLLWPKAFVVGATEEEAIDVSGRIRGHLYKGGIDRIDYLKFSTDGASRGSGVGPVRLPTFADRSIAIGVLICKDFQQSDLRGRVLDHLAVAAASLRLVCIPADMGSEWFPGDSVNLFPGAYLAVSNNRRTPFHTRRQSFIAGPDGSCLVQERNCEAIVLDTPQHPQK